MKKVKTYEIKQPQNWNLYLTNLGLYAIQSEADKKTFFVLDEKDFVMIRGRKCFRWKISDTPEAIKEIENTKVHKEILGIYEDIKDLVRMERVYWRGN